MVTRALLFGFAAFAALSFAPALPVSATTPATPLERADVNQDGVVSVADLALVMSDFGAETTGRADVTGNGRVNVLDLITVVTYLGQSTAPATLNSVERFIASRGDHGLRHEINLPAPLSGYSFGQQATEDNKSLPQGAATLNAWLAVQRDASQLNLEIDVKVNVRNMRCYAYQPSSATWIATSDGLPVWAVSFDYSGANDGNGNWTDIAPTVEADGTLSYDVPVGRGLHMSSRAPGGPIQESGGVACTAEARLLGRDATIARLGMASGADYRDADGSQESIQQAGYGRLGLLTANWKAFDMLSSVLSDEQVRRNPPPVVR